MGNKGQVWRHKGHLEGACGGFFFFFKRGAKDLFGLYGQFFGGNFSENASHGFPVLHKKNFSGNFVFFPFLGKIRGAQKKLLCL